jgi:CRISPR-associated protein Csx3
MKVVLCGPPRSGKSCLRQGLKDAVRRIPGAPYPFVITACPDGEGAWFQETVNADPALATACKAAYKAKFTPEFTDRVAASVRNCELALTLVDIGGIPSAENEAICASATHAVVLLGDPAREAEWIEFCRKVGLKVVAVIRSDYNGTTDAVPALGEYGVLRGSVHHLERGELVAERPTIRALAEILADMANRGE